MQKEIEVVATISVDTTGDGSKPTILSQRALTRCKNCRWYKNQRYECTLFGTDKDPEGFCDEGIKKPEPAEEVTG